jgi:hypothetical protein
VVAFQRAIKIQGGTVMKKILSLFLAAMVVLLGAPLPSPAGNAGTSIVGTVLNSQGNPVQGVQIVVKDAQGNVVGQATTNAQGQYTIANLPPGEYTLTLDPLKTGYQGNTVVASLPAQGLTADWLVAADKPAIAAAKAGIDPGGLFGLGPTGTAILGFTVLTGLGFGIAAGAGAFGDGKKKVVTGTK